VIVTLVRHGESTWNELALVQGQNDDARLTEEGRAQALDAATSLIDEPFDAIISSDLTRAFETAAIIARELGLEVVVTPGLRERSFGVFEGRPQSELDWSESGIRDGRVVDAVKRLEGGESLDDLYDRCSRSLQDLVRGSARHPLVVTHGGPIRALRAFNAGAEMANLEWDSVGNCSIWTLNVARPVA
jgi:broad specificity phosphatase PhoE